MPTSLRWAENSHRIQGAAGVGGGNDILQENVSLSVVILLICSGIFVGVVNTFAGAAAVVSISVYTALGLPIEVANGTNRLPVLFQVGAAAFNFRKQRLLDYSVGLRLGIPTALGAVAGAEFAAWVDPSVFVVLLATILILLLTLLLFSPNRILQGNGKPLRRVHRLDYLWFFLVGIYGGAFQIGMGYVILGLTIMGMGYDVITANALKSFIVMLYIPLTLAVYMVHGQVAYGYGLVHAVGNVIGAYVASKYATRIDTRLLRWLLILFIALTVLDLFRIISIRDALEHIL